MQMKAPLLHRGLVVCVGKKKKKFNVQNQISFGFCGLFPQSKQS